jgi:hypothetical protein
VILKPGLVDFKEHAYATHNKYAHFSSSEILKILHILWCKDDNFMTQEISCLFGYELICGVHNLLIVIKGCFLKAIYKKKKNSH